MVSDVALSILLKVPIMEFFYRPPFDGVVHATHCLLEVKTVSDFSLYIPLAKQGIFCVNTLYLSDYLYRTSRDIKDSILPHFAKYY